MHVASQGRFSEDADPRAVTVPSPLLGRWIAAHCFIISVEFALTLFAEVHPGHQNGVRRPQEA
jgi:hypothetical protein